MVNSLRYKKKNYFLINISLFPRSLIQIDGREYFICQTNTAALLNIPEAIPWGMDEDDLEGNPVLVLVRLKE